MSGRGAIGSALALGARGCEFESRRPDHKKLKGYNIYSVVAFFIIHIFILWRNC